MSKTIYLMIVSFVKIDLINPTHYFGRKKILLSVSSFAARFR